MENIAIKIRALIISEISGTISKNEQRYLKQLIDRYPEVRALSDYLHEVLNSTSCNESDEEIEDEIRLIIQIGNERRESLKKRKNLYSLAAMSSAAALFLMILHLTLKPVGRPAKQHQTPSVPQNSKQVVLSINNKSYELHGRKLWVHKDGSMTTDNVQDANIPINRDGQNIINDSMYVSPPNTPNSKELASVNVPDGKIYEVKLSDTTSVTINSASNIRFPINFGRTREIFVQGEVRIRVAHDTSRPFWVNTGNIRVQALGTIFNVNTYNRSTPKVALLSGKVKIIGGNKNVVLEKDGKMATFTDGNFLIEPFDPEEMAWASDTIFLNNADEQQVMEAFARYFDTQIVFDKHFNGRKARLKLDRNLPVRTLLEQLPGGYTIEETGNVYHLK